MKGITRGFILIVCLDDEEDKEINISKSLNMKYIRADGQEYFTSDRTVYYGSGASFNVGFFDGYTISGTIWNGDGQLCSSDEDGGENRGSYTAKIRPVVVISSNVLIEDLDIGNYWIY